jgi:hypothetical protein
MRLAAEGIGTAPIDRVDVLHGTRVAQAVRPFAARYGKARIIAAAERRWGRES